LDVSEFESQTNKIRHKLRGYALYLTRNANDADDLVQSTLLRAFRKLDQYSPGTNLRAWMSMIMKNLFISERRKTMGRAHVLVYVDELPDFAAPAALDNEVSPHILTAVDELPEYYRIVFVENVLHDLSYAEIAKKHRIPLGTVMSRLNRARTELRRKLGDGGTKEKV
jgi:RNA polymerase sigma-70 factor, ECF subfamily